MQKSPKNTAAFAGIILLGFSVIGLYLGYLVIKGIFVPLLFAIIFSVVCSPIYHWFQKKTHNDTIASILTSVTLIVVVLGVVSFIIYLAVGEVVSVTKVFTQSLDLQRMEFLLDQEQVQQLVDETIVQINSFLEKVPFVDASALANVVVEVLKNIPPLLQNLSSYLIGWIRIGFDSATKGIVSLVIFFISFFYLLIDGRKFTEYTYDLLPINALHERQISRRFGNLCYAWIVVNLLLAGIQGGIAAFGFALIGVPSALIWGIVTMLASFIPFVGSALIWGTITLIYLIIGQWWSALMLVILGIVISSSDNLLRPFLLKEGIEIHPLVVFLAVFGGFFAFGIPGLIIGPVIMVFISTLLYIYQLEFHEVLKEFHYDGGRKKSKQ